MDALRPVARLPQTDDPTPALAFPAPRRTLLVEDEAVVAMLVEELLTELGCETVEVAGRLGEALHLAETDAFDFAVLDVNLGGVPSYPVADALLRRGTSFVFTTGYGIAGIDRTYADVPIVHKPFELDALAAAMTRALSRG